MGMYSNVGTSSYTIASDGHASLGTPQGYTGLTANDSAPSSSTAFLVSELEKRDPLVRQPLTTYTWSKNVPVKTGGGWAEFASALNIDFGISGGSGDAGVSTNGVNDIPVIQANFGKDLFKTHIAQFFLRLNFFDIDRAQFVGRSLDALLTDGIRLNYEKHMDQNVFKGMTNYGTTGLLNNPNVYAQTVATGAASSTLWANKTPTEILADINGAINTVWAAAGNDMTAIPNHILLPFTQYNYIATTKVSELTSDTSILTYLERNNVATANGSKLVFGMSNYATGAGSGGTDRMAVYVSDPRFIAVEELVPLQRRISAPNLSTVSMDTLYAANVSEVEFFYLATVGYFDGI